jgi:HK97 gp10 family phage protein
MMKLDMQIKGLDAVGKALLGVPEKIRQNVARGALRAGAKTLKERAIAELGSHVKSGELRDSIRVTSRVRGDNIIVRVVAGNRIAYYAHMIERGVAAHYIKLDEAATPTRKTRRGERKVSIGTVNKMVSRGSLKIGGRFVGSSVHHPGFGKKPFMRPAIDNGAQDALEAVREYIRKRLRSKHGIDVPYTLQDGDE